MRIGLMFVTPKSSEDKSKKKGTLKIALKGARNLPTRPGGVSPSTYCKWYVVVLCIMKVLLSGSSQMLQSKNLLFRSIEN